MAFAYLTIIGPHWAIHEVSDHSFGNYKKGR